MVINTCPLRTCSPDFTRIRVSAPSTCGWMLAERRDFTVAMYSSTRGTGLSWMVWVLTGNGWGAGGFARVFVQPVQTNVRVNNSAKRKIATFLTGTILISEQQSWVGDARHKSKDSICARLQVRVKGLRAGPDAGRVEDSC